MIHSVDSFELAEEIDKKSEKAGRKTDILIEVNIADEDSKTGYRLSELYKEIEKFLEFKNINVKGLMTMAPLADNKDVVREVFKNLRELKDELNEKYFKGNMTELSMGMTNDYEIALEEGATILRIGSKIFL